jgi:2-hydroxychromene-2-carboxylate isomerase
MPEIVTLYIDYRSPYSYLAKDDAFQLEQDFDVRVDWYPFYTDLTGAYGGNVEQRTARDWAKVKYLYMDCRRIANRRGLTVRGTQKIYDPRLVSHGMLYAKRHGVFRAYHEYILPKFWNREFDIENLDAVTQALAAAGAPAGFADYLHEEAEREFAVVQADAEAKGVFGVPTFVFRGELFWGTDRIGMLREVLAPLARRASPTA